MIKVNNISKSFVNTQVISNISATFEKGKTNLIIGQSGSGKTVLLKSIFFRCRPTQVQLRNQPSNVAVVSLAYLNLANESIFSQSLPNLDKDKSKGNSLGRL